jgi:hypothetical protein
MGGWGRLPFGRLAGAAEIRAVRCRSSERTSTKSQRPTWTTSFRPPGPEGLTIEYKRDPYGNRDADRKEALKDITSFANSAAGHLINGMKEAKGVRQG